VHSQTNAVAAVQQNQAYSSHVASNDQVILATAIVKVRDRFGQLQLAGALLDSGSKINFMAEDLAQCLRLHREESYLNITTVGNSDSVVRHKVHTSIHSRVNAHIFGTDFWALRSISTYQPDHEVNCAQWSIPVSIELATPRFFKPARVELLIVAEIYFELLSVGQIKLVSRIYEKVSYPWSYVIAPHTSCRPPLLHSASMCPET